MMPKDAAKIAHICSCQMQFGATTVLSQWTYEHPLTSLCLRVMATSQNTIGFDKSVYLHIIVCIKKLFSKK